jgi:hypothetical protein
MKKYLYFMFVFLIGSSVGFTWLKEPLASTISLAVSFAFLRGAFVCND